MFSFTSSEYSGGTRSPSRAADELDAVDTDEAGELTVGIQDDVAMDQHRLVDAVAEVGKHLRRGARAVALVRRGCASQQVVDRGDQRRDLRPDRVADRLDPRAGRRWQSAAIAAKARPTLSNSRRCSQYSTRSSVATSAKRRHNSPTIDI